MESPNINIDINETNTKIKLNNKLKLINVSKLNRFNQKDSNSDENISQTNDINFNQAFLGPMARAHAKCINYKNAV
jgi:hypothetical protein